MTASLGGGQPHTRNAATFTINNTCASTAGCKCTVSVKQQRWLTAYSHSLSCSHLHTASQPLSHRVPGAALAALPSSQGPAPTPTPGAGVTTYASRKCVTSMGWMTALCSVGVCGPGRQMCVCIQCRMRHACAIAVLSVAAAVVGAVMALATVA